MTKTKRYTLSQYRPGYVIEDINGRYMLYSDYQKEIDKLNQEIIQLKSLVQKNLPFQLP